MKYKLSVLILVALQTSGCLFSVDNEVGDTTCEVIEQTLTALMDLRDTAEIGWSSAERRPKLSQRQICDAIKFPNETQPNEFKALESSIESLAKLKNKPDATEEHVKMYEIALEKIKAIRNNFDLSCGFTSFSTSDGASPDLPKSEELMQRAVKQIRDLLASNPLALLVSSCGLESSIYKLSPQSRIKEASLVEGNSVKRVEKTRSVRESEKSGAGSAKSAR